MEVSGISALIDIFFLILCLRVIYIAVSRGIPSESFKLAGLLIGSFLAFAYYPYVGKVINDKIPILKKEYFHFVSFFFILLGVVIVFSLARLITAILFKREKIPYKERWVALIMGVLRFCLLSSVILFILHLSPLKPKHLNESITYGILKNVAPKYYLVTHKIYELFEPKAILNEEVRDYYETEKYL